MERQRIKELRFTLGRAASASAPLTRKRPRGAALEDDGDEAVEKEQLDVRVRLVELIDALEKAEDSSDLHYGLFVWPCALVLAHFVAHHNMIRFGGRTVLELGCGIALPGILAALCGGAKRVILSDRADSVNIQRNVEINVALNGIVHKASYLPLNWGALDLLDHIDQLQDVDIVLAADCFYQSDDFEKVLATVATIFRLNPSATFITTYQLRSINRTIAPLLQRYGMTARHVGKSEFMDLNGTPSVDSVYLYEISPLHY